MSDVTQLIYLVKNGEAGASNSLMEAVYGELRLIARSQMARESPGHTLQTTALVNEAFLRLFAGKTEPTWENRAHFFGAAAEAMRRILVDHARKKQSLKRGGDAKRIGDVAKMVSGDANLDELLDVHEVLEEFAADHPDKAKLVKLRYFAGMTISQAAELLQISVPTANRHWAYSRAWLFERIRSGRPG